MSLNIITAKPNPQIPFGQVGNLVSSGVLQKKSVEQIVDTEVSYCNFSFTDFTNIFRFEVDDIIWDGLSDQIIFKLQYAETFFVFLTLKGYWEIGEEQKFQLTEVDWNFEDKEASPTSAFVLNTFLATLCLSNKVKVEIPTIDYYFSVSVPSPLNQVSEILQTRQIAYRLMVIEKAFQVSLPFPISITAEEVENIAFCYYSIVNRNFEWAGNSLTIFPTAEKDNLKYLPQKNATYHLTFPTLNEIRKIFNHQLSLGQFLIEIEKAEVENYDEVKEQFEMLNGKTVKVIIKSLTGKSIYKSLNAPHLPKKIWKRDLQSLVDLDEKFNSSFLEKYFTLATSTLEDLSIEQKEAITERPKLSIKGFD